MCACVCFELGDQRLDIDATPEVPPSGAERREAVTMHAVDRAFGCRVVEEPPDLVGAQVDLAGRHWLPPPFTVAE